MMKRDPLLSHNEGIDGISGVWDLGNMGRRLARLRRPRKRQQLGHFFFSKYQTCFLQAKMTKMVSPVTMLTMSAITQVINDCSVSKEMESVIQSATINKNKPMETRTLKKNEVEIRSRIKCEIDMCWINTQLDSGVWCWWILRCICWFCTGQRQSWWRRWRSPTTLWSLVRKDKRKGVDGFQLVNHAGNQLETQ